MVLVPGVCAGLARRHLEMGKLDATARRYFPAIVGGSLAATAWMNARALNMLLVAEVASETRPSGVSEHSPPVHSERESVHTTSADAILERNPFDSVTGPLERIAVPEVGLPGEEAKDLPCEAGRVVLIAQAEDPAWSFAAISFGGHDEMLRRCGDELEGWTLEEIGWDRVWMAHDGRRCHLQLGVEDPSRKPARRVGPAMRKRVGANVPLEISSRIRKISDTEYVVDRTAVDSILDNQAQLMRSVRIVPETRGGRPAALRVSRVRPDSVLGLVGIRAGDRIRSINGFSLTDPQAALEAYARLRTADRLSLALERAGKDMRIDVRIQ